MSCECYQIGGRFIGADPDCYEHGDHAREREEELDQLRTELAELKAEKDLLKAQVERLELRLQAQIELKK